MPDLDIHRMHGTAYAPNDSTGATLADGRWHTRGTRVLYAAQHISLAVLETLIHAGGRKLPPRSLTRITIPNGLATETASWLDLPRSRTFGDRWVRENRTAVLAIPSIAVNKMELNYVLNPFHPDFASLTFHPSQPFAFDPRFIFFP